MCKILRVKDTIESSEDFSSSILIVQCNKSKHTLIYFDENSTLWIISVLVYIFRIHLSNIN